MQQIAQYRAGERDYTLIKGATGPLVYPAGASVFHYPLHGRGGNKGPVGCWAGYIAIARWDKKLTTVGGFVAHVYIYNALYRVTDEGRDVLFAQGIFMGVYLVALGFVFLCYRMAKVRPYHELSLHLPQR